jgi:hypothetical protein
MNKYNIEGEINFYESLNKLIENDTNNDTENDKICLITNEPLTEFFVSLSCGHTFNYKPLYYDLLNYKSKFVNLEFSSNKLGLNEIRCPYCRCKINQLLPYHEELGLELVNGINMYNIALPGPSYIPRIKCEYILDNDILCNKIYGTNIVHDKHGNIIGNNKFYCKFHAKIILKTHNTELKEKAKLEKEAKLKAKEDAKAAKLKAKEDAKAAKLKAKEDAKAAKLKAKEDAKAAKLKAKEDAKNIVVSNVSPIQTSNQTCTQILLSGPNKGNSCGKKELYGQFV